MRRLTRWALPTAALLATAAVLVPASTAGHDPVVAPAGNFVIGDTTLSRTNHVYFWGSQWWKNNEVSSDDTHPSFKGYALSVDTAACTLTSRPGNSAPPPDSPLGDTITVVVTSKVVKNGPTLSGTVVAFAQVAVDPGYDDNPGHEGTGTVVSYSPCFAGGAGGPGEL